MSVKETLNFDSSGRVSAGDRELTFPHGFWITYELVDSVALFLQPGRGGYTDPDVSLPDPTQTIVAVSEDCRVEWLVDPVAVDDPAGFHHLEPKTDGERLITHGPNDRYYGIAPSTGEILDQWAADEFVINGVTHQLSGPIDDIRYFDGKVLIEAGVTDIYAFDSERGHLWTREHDKRWTIGCNDTCKLYPDEGRIPRWKCSFELDVETGELIRPVNAPDKIIKKHMGEEWVAE